MLRTIKRVEKLQMIFETIYDSMPSFISLGALLLLFLFLFSIIGTQLFCFLKLQTDINAHANFQSFVPAFLLLLRAATGEAWNSLMFDTMRGHGILFQCD